MPRVPRYAILIASGLAWACTSTLVLRAPDDGSNSPVQSVSAAATTSQGIVVSWSDAPAASEYDLYFAQDPSVSPANFASLPGGQHVAGAVSPFHATALDAGAEWTFTVVATVGGVAQPASPRVSAPPVGVGAQAPPVAVDAGWSTTFAQADARFAYPITGAGDVDGDGFDDVLIGAYNYDGGSIGEGIVFLYRGGANGLLTPPAWSFECDQASAHCGTAALTGDFDGDGELDAVIGASDYTSTETSEGFAALFPGAGGSFAASNWQVYGGASGVNMGRHLAGAGDVNGDGKDDLLVPTHSFSNGQMGEGRVELYLGTAGGLSQSVAWSAESGSAGATMGWSLAAGDVNGDGDVDVAAGGHRHSAGQNFEGGAWLFLGTPTVPSTTAVWTRESNQVDAYLGWSLAFADVNGDDYDDLVLGTYRWDGALTDEGRVEVFHGSGSGLSTTADWTRVGGQAGARFGSTVVNAGDLDGDGIDDLLVGAYGWDGVAADAGKAFLYTGSPSGLSDDPAWEAEGDSAQLYFGGALGVADVNGDGRNDLLVGVQEDYAVQSVQSGAWIFFGPPLTGPSIPLAMPASTQPGMAIPPPAATFADPATTGHRCRVTWGDSTPEVVVSPCDPAALAATTHPFTDAGRYVVRVRVENDYALAAEAAAVVSVTAGP